MTSTETPAVSITIFFKFKERVKKGVFTGRNLEDLKELFLEKYPEFQRYSLRPFQILNQDSQIPHELDEIEDLYPNCVLEIVKSDPDSMVGNKVHRRMGYYGRENEKMIICLVGLPFRGKSFTARRLGHLLNWLGIPTKVFNVGEYRRQRLGTHPEEKFYDPDNKAEQRSRLHIALAALDELLMWLNDSGGLVGIYDAANISDERRKLVASRCMREGIPSKNIIFVELVSDDPDILAQNIRDTQLSSPDYVGQDPQAVVTQILGRISNFGKEYQSIPEEGAFAHPFIKIHDGGKKIILSKINGYLPGRMVFFLMNLHASPRPVWLTRCGEHSLTKSSFGRDEELTTHGDIYAHNLAAWIEGQEKKFAHGETDLMVWTSTLKRAIRTAQYIPYPKVQLRGLDDLERGICDGMSNDEIAQNMPEEYAARASDKLFYRYPRGESYEDVMQRLEPVMFELERSRHPVLIVSHLAPLRCLYGYLMGVPQEDCLKINIPQNVVIELTPNAYGCDIKHHNI